MPANTSTVRVSSRTRNILRDLATRTGESMQALLDRAIEEYRRKRFLEEANAAFSVLRESPEEWKAEIEERKTWDATLADDLGKE